jgi:hypothetical protein
MRLRIKQARPINLNDAIRHAVELEAFNKAELKRNEGGGYLRSARFGFAFVLSGRNEPRVPSPHNHSMSHLLWDKTGQRVQAFHKHDIVLNFDP